MVFKIIYLTLALSFLGCANRNATKLTKEITFQIYDAKPHCGGAAPDPEMQYPLNVPVSGITLWIYSVDDAGKIKAKVGEIKTAEEGTASVQLPEGNYQLLRPTKLLSLDEFIETESQMKSKYFSYKDAACFEKWKSTPDYSFTTEQANHTIVYQNRCYTGSHPCMEYSGPMAP